jgi:hypothetical protein
LLAICDCLFNIYLHYIIPPSPTKCYYIFFTQNLIFWHFTCHCFLATQSCFFGAKIMQFIWRLDDRGLRVSSPGRVKNFLFSPSRPVLVPTQLPFQWVQGGKAAQGVKLTTHLQLVSRSRKRGSIHPLPHSALLVKHRDLLK